MDTTKVQEFIHGKWQEADGVVDTLKKYISIDSCSPMFDEQWNTNGKLMQTAELMVDWARRQNVVGLSVELLKEPDRTPLIFMELPARGPDSRTVLMYGHQDKQPPFDGWRSGLGPYLPVLVDNKLYGRGGADDGYAIFSCITAMLALQKFGLDHPRLVVVIEACEESSSADLMPYLNKMDERIGDVAFVVCLDSGCGNYDQMWLTTSLRGAVAAVVNVEVASEGVHSGDGSGVIPSTVRIWRQLLDRIECSKTGRVLMPEFWTDIPEHRVDETREVASVLGERDGFVAKYPFLPGVSAVDGDGTELLLNRCWRPQMEVTGAAGMPSAPVAGNVLRPSTTFKLSIRIPPTVDPNVAFAALEKALTTDVPYNARVTIGTRATMGGWNSPALQGWLTTAINEASTAFYGKPCLLQGEGGSIPFMKMLGDKYPNAQFLITGVLGPNSNAHGPNEFLDIPYAERLTGCVAYVLNTMTKKD